MDKRNQMENPFFDPDKPGSIFVGMDRYHQYSPHQPQNALTFIQKGDADSLFRKFLIDNIKEAECCPYIPDTELLRFDLANMRQVPPVDTHTPFEEYISKELLPYFQEHCIPPAKRISLRDAVYTYKYKNEPDGGILKKYLMQEPAYLEFRLQQQEKRTLYRCQPRYTFPLKVVENDFGYLIFPVTRSAGTDSGSASGTSRTITSTRTTIPAIWPSTTVRSWTRTWFLS